MLDKQSRENEQERWTKVANDLRKALGAVTDSEVQGVLAAAALELDRHGEPDGAPSVKARIRAALAKPSLSAGMEGAAPITDNAKKVLEHRYFLKGSDGKPIEDSEVMFRRVAKAIAEIDRIYSTQPKRKGNADSKKSTSDDTIRATEEKFYQVMSRLEFLPNSPTMMNAGTGAGTLSACFVLPLEDSMEDIMRTATDIAMVQKYGGGTGLALSNLRPKGSQIRTTHGKACGPIAVLRHLSSVSTMITQGGKRDGANMAVMDVHHPDLFEFISAKHEEGTIHNYNISVGVDDAFMEAVHSNSTVPLWDPTSGREVGVLDAKDAFEQMVSGAWRNGEPGMIFLDQVNRDNPTPLIGQMTATNPCGEQPLLPYESCNLGSIVLSRMLRDTSDGVEIDWEKLRTTVQVAVHFLDNVIDANRYSVSEIERMTKLTRKIGLGVMGFADMLVSMGIPYDSQEGLSLGGQVMQFIKEGADTASMELAKSRGVFPAFNGSRHDDGDPQHRYRNACRLTVAPTGTISMIAGCSSGIEPLFALAYRKQNILEGQTLYYVDRIFEAVARHESFYSDDLAEALAEGQMLKDQSSVPAWVSRIFATAPEITPEWHVRMQAAFQEHTDAAISKTINFPNEATEADVREAYSLAWELGCKGITVYRAGSREKEVLTVGTVSQGQENGRTSVDQHEEDQALATISLGGPTPKQSPGHSGLHPRQRPQRVKGVTERVRTGHGNFYITINFDEENRPFEVFTALGKAGSSDSAQLEAVARLVSMALRAGVAPQEIVDQLRGITDEPVWDNGVLVRSAPDALALALGRTLGLERAQSYPEGLEFLDSTVPVEADPTLDPAAREDQPVGRAGWGACPQCSGPLVFQEGCLMCRECGYNKCG
jgi:ribonucleoside-diphosphate reductase alpha chain